MKFEIMRDRLLDGLNDVMKAISQKVADSNFDRYKNRSR